MMEYLYSGSIANFNPRVALDLLGLADAYMLEGLKYLCENTLMHNVDNDNVCALLIDANKYSSAELKKFCITFLIKNFQEVQNTKGFEDLEYYPSLLMEVTKLVFSNVNNKENPQWMVRFNAMWPFSNEMFFQKVDWKMDVKVKECW